MLLLKKWFKFSKIERVLFLEALLFLYFEKLRIHFIAFKFLIKETHLDPQQKPTIDFLKQIRIAIRRANKLTFWSNVCLVKSLAARRMLSRRRISSTIHFGFRFSGQKKIEAHAWLISGGVEITPRGNQEFKEIGVF